MVRQRVEPFESENALVLSGPARIESRMEPSQVIQPGDRVIDLASLARTSGAGGGLAAGILVT